MMHVRLYNDAPPCGPAVRVDGVTESRQLPAGVFNFTALITCEGVTVLGEARADYRLGVAREDLHAALRRRARRPAR